jgi:hypothetical protein
MPAIASENSQERRYPLSQPIGGKRPKYRAGVRTSWSFNRASKPRGEPGGLFVRWPSHHRRSSCRHLDSRRPTQVTAQHQVGLRMAPGDRCRKLRSIRANVDALGVAAVLRSPVDAFGVKRSPRNSDNQIDATPIEERLCCVEYSSNELSRNMTRLQHNYRKPSYDSDRNGKRPVEAQRALHFM